MYVLQAFSHWSGGSTQQSQLPVGGGGLHVQGSPEDELEADELADDTAELATDDDAPDDELATAMPPIPLDDDDATPEDELAALTDPVLVSEDDEADEALDDTCAEKIDPPSPWLIGAGPKTSRPEIPQPATQMAHKAIACFMRIVLPHPCAARHGSSLTRGFHLTR